MDDGNIKSYEAADAALHDKRTGKPVQSRKLRPNTYLQRRGLADPGVSPIAIRLHNTDIVTFRNDGFIELNTDGWFTITTKDRMNRYLPDPFCIFSKKGSWHVSLSWKIETVHRDHNYEEIHEQHDCSEYYCYDRKEIATSVPYFDGIILDGAGLNNGSVVNAKDIPDERARDKRNDEMRRKIRNYVRRYTDERIRELAETGAMNIGGECMFCWRTTEGESVGDAFGDIEHLRSHIDEGYVMYSLLWHAVKANGRRDPAFVMAYAPDLARHDLSKYLRKRLLEAVMVNH